MHYKRFGNKVIVRVDKGEEIVKTLKQVCKDMDIKLGTVIGIGATDRATIGLYDVKAKEYRSKELIGDYEIAPICGNISRLGDEVYLHLHANLCNAEHKSFGGHLNSATVSATFEAVIEIIDGEINRVVNKKIGLNLMNI